MVKFNSSFAIIKKPLNKRFFFEIDPAKVISIKAGFLSVNHHFLDFSKSIYLNVNKIDAVAEFLAFGGSSIPVKVFCS
jgi:hypothetical protein